MNRHRTTTAILAVIAFLLAAHLAVWLGGNEAHAQAPDQPGPPTTEPPSSGRWVFAEPTVVGGSAVKVGTVTDRFYRFWSDGTVDVSVRHFDGTADSCILEFACGPEVMIDPGP